jgi:hypothetical protein
MKDPEKLKIQAQKAADLIVECFDINDINPSAGITAMINIIGIHLAKKNTRKELESVISALTACFELALLEDI